MAGLDHRRTYKMAPGGDSDLETKRGTHSDFEVQGTPIQDRNELPTVGPVVAAPNLDHGALKERIAEVLVEQLFVANGYTVFRYGINATTESAGREGNNIATVTNRMPALVALRGHDTVYLEVRFGAEEFGCEDLPDDYPFDDAYTVVVTKEHIKCATVRELNEGHRITPTSPGLLERGAELGLDKDTVEGLCQFATRLFGSV